jgi:hypothetical protein
MSPKPNKLLEIGTLICLKIKKIDADDFSREMKQFKKGKDYYVSGVLQRLLQSFSLIFAVS